MTFKYHGVGGTIRFQTGEYLFFYILLVVQVIHSGISIETIFVKARVSNLFDYM